MKEQTDPLLEIEGLRTGFRTRTGMAWAVVTRARETRRAATKDPGFKKHFIVNSGSC